jgi:hypothetical protein
MGVMARNVKFFALILTLLISCGEDPEKKLRHKFGIPDDAKKVLIIGQSSHIDPDWILTLDEYYENFVRNIILSSLDYLSLSKSHYYSLAETLLIKKFYEENPNGKRDELKARIEEGRFFILGGGFSTPDTLVPDNEAIIMNYFYGIDWLRKNISKDIKPITMWLPDDFGHSPLLPDLAQSLGFKYAGFARVDGLGTTIQEFGEGITRPYGSTAEILERERAIDFIWKGVRGRIIAHWMPFSLYCEGDDIDIGGQSLPGGFLGVYLGFDRDFTNSKIKEYIEKLEPISPTPYMFLSIGCDFTLPKKNLYLYVKRWNEEMFKKTGVWVAVGTFEGFMKLVEFHRDKLKEFSFDINPYFMGFYASRGYLKELHKKAVSYALSLESLNAILKILGMESNYNTFEIWEKIGFSTHHDFVTGTSPLRVVKNEQIPVLNQVIDKSSSVLSEFLNKLTEKVDTSYFSFPVLFLNPYPRPVSYYFESEDKEGVFKEKGFYSIGDSGFVYAEGGRIYGEVRSIPALGYRTFDLKPVEPTPPFEIISSILSTPFYRVEINDEPPFIKAVSKNGEKILEDAGIIKVYHDDGGLWRMGNEMKGCEFKEKYSENSIFGSLSSFTTPLTSVIQTEIFYPENSLRVSYLFFRSLPYIKVRVSGKANKRETITFSLKIPFCEDGGCHFKTSVPPAFFERPSRKIFNPTFWSANGGVIVEYGGKKMVLVFNRATGVKWDGNGTVEIITHRNAPAEKCESLGLVNEETGIDPYSHTFEITIISEDSLTDEDALSEIFSMNFPPIFLFPSVKKGELPPEISILSVSGCAPTIFKVSEKGFIMRAIEIQNECEIFTNLELEREKSINSIEDECEECRSIVKNFVFRKK